MKLTKEQILMHNFKLAEQKLLERIYFKAYWTYEVMSFEDVIPAGVTERVRNRLCERFFDYKPLVDGHLDSLIEAAMDRKPFQGPISTIHLILIRE